MGRSEMLSAFNFAFREYIRIFNTESNGVQDWVMGRATLFGKGREPDHSEFVRVAKNFREAMIEDHGRIDACFQCCTALTCFVKFLACDKPYPGYDERFRGIFNTRHLDFKNEWVHALRGMVTYTEGLYSDDKKAWNYFLTTRNINWTDIQRKLVNNNYSYEPPA
jgi:hypothetical protein